MQRDGVHLQQLLHSLSDLFRRGDGGVANGEVIDVLLAKLGSLLHAVLKQHTDAALGYAHLMEFFYDHSFSFLSGR